MPMCSSLWVLNLCFSKLFNGVGVFFLKSCSCFFTAHYHTFPLHPEIKLSIRKKHRTPTELKILNLTLLYLPFDRSTHLTLRSVYNLCQYKSSKMTKSQDVTSWRCRIRNLNGQKRKFFWDTELCMTCDFFHSDPWGISSRVNCLFSFSRCAPYQKFKGNLLW